MRRRKGKLSTFCLPVWTPAAWGRNERTVTLSNTAVTRVVMLSCGYSSRARKTSLSIYLAFTLQIRRMCFMLFRRAWNQQPGVPTTSKCMCIYNAHTHKYKLWKQNMCMSLVGIVSRHAMTIGITVFAMILAISPISWNTHADNLPCNGHIFLHACWCKPIECSFDLPEWTVLMCTAGNNFPMFNSHMQICWMHNYTSAGVQPLHRSHKHENIFVSGSFRLIHMIWWRLVVTFLGTLGGDFNIMSEVCIYR